MVKHTASMTSFRQSSNLFEVLGLEGMAAGFVQNWNDAASRNLLTGENLPSAVSGIEQTKTAHWSRLELISDELSSSSEKTFHAVSDGQLMERLVPQNGSTMSALNFRRGQSGICHTIPAYCDSTSTRSSLFTSRTFQNLRTSSHKLEEHEEADAKRDTELTLGQPHQRSQKMEHPFSRVIRPMVLAKSVNSQSLASQGHQISAKFSPNPAAKFPENRQNIHGAAAWPKPCPRREHNQLNFMNHPYGVNNALGSNVLETKSDAANNSVNTTTHSKVNISSGINECSKISNVVVTGVGQLIPRELHCETYTDTCDLMKFSLCKGNGTERLTHNNGHGNMIRQRVVVSAADCSCLATTSNFGFLKQIYGSSSFHGSGDLNGNKNCSTADCAYSHSRQSCGLLQDVSHCSKTFSYNETASSTKSNEPPDHNLHQLNRSHVDYGRLSAFEISDGFQTAPSIAIPCMRLHPPRNIMGLSTKQHTDAYFKMQEGQMSSKSCSVVETHVPIIDLSTTEERSHEPSPIRWVAASGVPQKSLQSEEGVNLQPKEMEMQHQRTCNSSLNMDPPLRFGGRENITLSSATKTDHQRYQQNSSCCTPLIGLKSCECQGKTFFSAVTNQKILQSEMCHLTDATQPSEFLFKREIFADELREIAYRWRTDTADSLKHEKPNDSSGSSAPFVSQLSVDVVNAGSCTLNAEDTLYADNFGSCTLNAEDTSYADNFGSCTLNAEDTSYAENFVVDEGSEIGICCSSDDGCGSKGTSVSFGIKSSSKAVEDEFSCGLDKLKLRNSSGIKVPLQSAEGLLHACGASFIEPSSKRSHPVLSGTEEKNKLYDHIEGEDVFQETKLKVIAGFLKNSEGKDGKKIENDVTNNVAGEQLQLHQRHSADADKHSELQPLIFVEAPRDWLDSVGDRIRKPVVCGEFGVISTGEVTFTFKKPAKIVPLSEVLKSAKRCTLPETQQKKLSSVKKLKKMNLRVRNKRFKGKFIWNRDGQYETCNDILCNELNSDILIEEGSTCVNKPPTLEKERYDGVNKASILVSSSAGQKRKGKQICNCSLFELAIEGEKCGSLKCSVAKKSKSSSWSHFRSSRSLQKQIEEHERVLDACCVCGSSKGTESNCLLECSQCLIQVHQDCYGVPKIHKSEWLCRACRTSAIDIVCSICKRPGGSWIQCRVPNCSVRFHLCCAHQKGLLQNEVESVDNGSFGFYATCPLHAMYPQYLSGSNSNLMRLSLAEEQVSACARTEGYKGRKSEGFQHTLHCEPNHMGGCLVPEEQLNAWLHINRQKPCVEWSSSLSAADVKHDPRKEYARYKKAKGWKNFVVYKSGIHGLGLYTSQFIPRDAMVVEYVGEVVRPRVADKREVEYLSGKKLQYKSACYFFRIDKEHIIDATCRGGIARFVNHSCLPNCIAKIISMGNQQKVLFFAERDIYPGEEITYDYHFNREDEGKKIPCLCQSKKCKRYLN